MIASRATDVAVTVLAAVAAPVDALLIDLGVWSAQVGTDVGAIVAAAVGAYHGGRHVQRKSAARRDPGGRHAAPGSTGPRQPGAL